jgi:hypothetical protein
MAVKRIFINENGLMRGNITLPEHFAVTNTEQNFGFLMGGELKRHFGYEVKVMISFKHRISFLNLKNWHKRK